MASQLKIDRCVEDVVAAYVATRRRFPLVSTSHALRAIRTVMPNCDATDRDLANMVAAMAIGRSLAISFDCMPAAEQLERSPGAAGIL